MNKWVYKWIRVYLKCYINLILYYRNVYPRESFDFTTYQGFNLPQFIPVTRHPGLQDYIENLILDLLTKITHIYKISILILDQQYDICLEKYTLDFTEFKHLKSRSKFNDDNNKSEEENNCDEQINETEVFDAFRSSLNSLINKVETLPKIKDDIVKFNVIINTMEMELGHAKDIGWNLNNKEDLNKFENDTNWTLCQNEDNENYFIDIYKVQPTIKMISLIGCDIGSIIIHNYMEVAQLDKMENFPLQSNDIFDVASENIRSTPF
ncbi:Rev7p PWA37_001039 [Arxiozyma heterogenica]|uniref:HORMA domain-containing protein n=1 Tax=Arxiozyma heterogenica TaxID=278026 RepID=A0AAN7WEV6_9SACH|nr:hypothetical protein RI543_004569 [Kazachstania heterogenica]